MTVCVKVFSSVGESLQNCMSLRPKVADNVEEVRMESIVRVTSLSISIM